MRDRLPGVGLFRNASVVLLASLATLFVAVPALEHARHERLLEVVLLTLVLVSAVLAIGGRRTMLKAALVLLAPAILCRWLSQLRPDLIPPAIAPAGALVLLGFTVFGLLRSVLRAPRVDANVLCAGLSGYLLLGLMWTEAYVLTGYLAPGSFASSGQPDGFVMEGFSAFYFSFVTLCTVGYGDVLPVTRVARMLVVVEAVAGLFYMAVIVARLVALYSVPASSPDKGA